MEVTYRKVLRIGIAKARTYRSSSRSSWAADKRLDSPVTDTVVPAASWTLASRKIEDRYPARTERRREKHLKSTVEWARMYAFVVTMPS